MQIRVLDRCLPWHDRQAPFAVNPENTPKLALPAQRGVVFAGRVARPKVRV